MFTVWCIGENGAVLLKCVIPRMRVSPAECASLANDEHQ